MRWKWTSRRPDTAQNRRASRSGSTLHDHADDRMPKRRCDGRGTDRHGKAVARTPSIMRSDAETANLCASFREVQKITALRTGQTIIEVRACRSPLQLPSAAIPIEPAAPSQHTGPPVHSLKASGRRPQCVRRCSCRAVIRNLPVDEQNVAVGSSSSKTDQSGDDGVPMRIG